MELMFTLEPDAAAAKVEELKLNYILLFSPSEAEVLVVFVRLSIKGGIQPRSTIQSR